MLDKANIEEVHGKVLEDLGKCDILINGAGGNNPKCTTAHEEYEKGDEQASDFLTFFNIDEKGFDYPYETVKDGDWTFDEFAYYAKKGSADLNGDGILEIIAGERQGKSLRYAVYTSQGENVVRVPEKTFGKLPAIR